MLYCDKTDVSEGIDVNKTSVSKVCGLCHKWRLLDKGFKFQSGDCNGSHDVLVINCIDIAVLNIRALDYYCILWKYKYTSKFNLTEKNIKMYYHILNRQRMI